MCYLIESKEKYILTDNLVFTVVKNEGIKIDYVEWTMTSDHDYLGTTYTNVGFMPFKFSSNFGDILNQKISTVQTMRHPLKCKKYNLDYTSEEQCLVSYFFNKDFSPCPVKCIPIQMRGFRYINSSTGLKNCNKLEDEICNGGPTVWKELLKHYEKCLKPCRVSSYDASLREKKDMTFIKDNENEASFEFVNSNVSPVEKEVLLYDLSDVIGTVGGSLGVGVGISVFAVISCCIDNFLELMNMFQNKALFERNSAS